MTKRKASVALETGTESNQSCSTQDNNSNSTSATNTTSGTPSNAHGMQNGSSNGPNGSDGQQRISSVNDTGSHKTKKERADNWSTSEIQVLHRGIESRRDIFYGPPSQATKKNRELAWEAITKEVNSVSTTPRSLGQVMKKFKNEKCRAKRKFIDNDKDGHNDSMISNSSVNSNNGTTNNNNGLGAQNHTNNSQLQTQQQQQQQTQQQQSHHMSSNDTMSTQPSSINVVKLAPQNVAKTMIDLPGHVQQIQMPNDDMVLIVPEMDGLLSGMNIVSDGNGHHFQKCTNNGALNGQQHGHQGQHTIQAINTGPGLVNGTMSNGMMTRTIPAGSMCSLVYSTGNEVCATDQHIPNNGVAGPNQLSTSHISVNTQNLMHHRGSVDQSQVQQQQQPPQQQLHHPLHHQQQQQHAQQPHQQQQHPHQPHQPAPHHQHQLQQNHLATTTTIANTGGVAVESQLKNLLFNLLLKDGQHSVPVFNNNQDYNKQRNDILATISSSLSKIESHLSKLTKVASSLYGQTIHNNSDHNDNSNIGNPSSINLSNNSMNMNNNDGNNNNVNLTSNNTGTGVITSHGSQES